MTVLLLFCGCLLWGQSAKRQMSQSDFESFSTLTQELIAPDGNWISYRLEYDNNAIDTLYLQAVKSAKRFNFPSAESASFSPDGQWFIALNPEKGIMLQNLSSDNVHWIPNVTKGDFFNNSKNLALQISMPGLEKLLIVDLNTNREYEIPGITNYKISSNGDIAAATDGKVILLSPKDNFVPLNVVKHISAIYGNISWNQEGTGFAFLETLDSPKDKFTNHKLYYYMGIKTIPKLFVLTSDQVGQNRYIVVPGGQEALCISPDGKRILFNHSKPEKIDVPEKVEVWDTHTPFEYPIQKNYAVGKSRPVATIWIPNENRTVEIATEERSSVNLTADFKFAISYDKRQYEPQYNLHGFADMWLTDIESGKSRLWLIRQSLDPNTMADSPNGRYIAYFRDSNWFLYDIREKTHTDLTSLWNVQLSNNPYGPLAKPQPYIGPNWTMDGQLVVHDQYDIWLINTEGRTYEKITDGSKSKVKYRITAVCEQPKEFTSYAMLSKYLDTSKGLILEATGNNMDSGFYYWKKGRPLKKWIYSSNFNHHLQKAKQADKYIYISEKSSQPPAIMFCHNLRCRPKLFYGSNQQHKKYKQGHTELLRYTSPEGKELKGLLYYPPDFILGKKYPMIVYIYEKHSQKLHHYLKPTNQSITGFSPANYIAQGYLIFLPDIVYEIGEPGNSALICVESGVKEIISKAIVDESHIGLIGHSYGGFEVAYIITQSKLFAAAVAGAAATDLVSLSLSMDIPASRPQMWRYETYQPRIGIPLFEDYNRYIRNSAVALAPTITTPLLSWSGKEDRSIDYRQSLELHLAMRRLGKRNIMLLYPGQGHLLYDIEKQLDLTLRISDWFGHYLKGQEFFYEEFRE